MKHETKHELKPKLRFPEFQDVPEWEEKQLYQIAKPVSDKATDMDENILTLSGEYGVVLQSDYFGKKIAGENVARYIRIALNDFVYNDRTTKLSAYGSIKRLSKYDSGIVSPIYKCFRFKNGENPNFWEWYFESEFHETQLHGLVNEGARAGRFNISIDKFLSALVWRPELLEQQKITDCLSSIDELITAQTQNLDALKAHKKGLMQQLFPAEDETVPKLRFPEFRNSEEWEAIKISGFAKVTTGNKDTQNKVDSGAYPFFVRSQTVESIDLFSYEGEAILTSGDGVGVGKNFHYINGKFDFHQRVYCIYGFKKSVLGKVYILLFFRALL